MRRYRGLRGAQNTILLTEPCWVSLLPLAACQLWRKRVTSVALALQDDAINQPALVTSIPGVDVWAGSVV